MIQRKGNPDRLMITQHTKEAKRTACCVCVWPSRAEPSEQCLVAFRGPDGIIIIIIVTAPPPASTLEYSEE